MILEERIIPYLYPKNSPVKKALLLFLLVITGFNSYSQQFVGKKWDARFGGTNFEQMTTVLQTPDGGYILGGQSQSTVSGNKTQPNWDVSLVTADYWIVKIDANGNYQWDKRYGGIGMEYFSWICTAIDGGYIIGGTTASDSGCDISQPTWGGYDYWIVKLDSLGNKQWDKRYGGSGADFLSKVKQTKDGGYIVAGSSNSGISGDKTQPNWDTTLSTDDYWIVKIDNAGNKQWDKRFGSTDGDGCNDIIQTPDGGYLIGGTSIAYDTSGDKTQFNFGYPYPTDNFWVVKTDSLGNKQWDKVFGGSEGEGLGNTLNTTDGNYLLGGQSYDGISGNKTAPLCGYWLVKIDTLGNKLGDWSYGSTNNGTGSGGCIEGFESMSVTTDGGYLLTGVGGPDTGGDKTSSSLANGENVWTIKIDSQMNRVWDRTSRTTGTYDNAAGAIENSAGCYMVGVMTAAGIGGDKTQPAWDSTYDYWIVEFCDSFPLGIQQPEGAMHLLVYPNPTSSDLYINIQKDNLTSASFTLTNTTGQTIYQSTADHLAHSYTKILDLSKLPAGVYMLDVVVDGERIVKKVLKE